MEQTPNTEHRPESSIFELSVDARVSSYLGETARWAKFLAILGFIVCGLILLAALFAGSLIAGSLGGYGGAGGLGAGMGVLISVFYVGGALLYFFPCLYLFRFASKMKTALRDNDQERLVTSFRNLKSCYKFMGILMIVILALYALVFIVAMLSAGLGFFRR